MRAQRAILNRKRRNSIALKDGLFAALMLGVALGMVSITRAEDFPAKPIRIIVPYAPGGSVDALARTVADKLREKWGQSVIVENRAGAGGNIGAEVVWRSAPDGYTLLFAAPGPYVINKSLYGKLAYEPETFAPIGIVTASHIVLAAYPRQGLESLQQLIAFAKANPGKLNYASSGNGTASHLAAELFKMMGGLNIGHVPYKGSAPAMADVLAGHADMTFVELSTALPQVRGAKLRALGVGSEKRKPVLPDVPAVAEALPGYVASTWFGMVAAPKTPAAIANQLSFAVAEALKQPEVAKRLSEMNVDAVGSTPAEMAQLMKQESERWGNVIRLAGTKAD